MKNITLGDFLTDPEIKRAAAIYEERLREDDTYNYAKRICDEIIRPNMERINKDLGQENDPMYLAYAVEFIMGEASK